MDIEMWEAPRGLEIEDQRENSAVRRELVTCPQEHSATWEPRAGRRCGRGRHRLLSTL